jgi:homoserine dehydrogenase
MVPASHPLHGVEDVFNAVYVHGNLVDNLMFYGRGAGKFPTASAVVSDMLDCALNIGANIPIRWSDEKMELSDPALNSSRFFVRIPASEKEKASRLFRGYEEVSLASAPADEAAFTTGSMKESSFEDCARQLSEVRKVIRLLED